MLNLKFLVALLWQRRLLFVATFLMVVAGAAAIIWARPSRFTADSLIALDTRPLRSALGVVSGQEWGSAASTVDPTILAGEINLLGSRAILARVIDETGLEAVPEFTATGTFLAGLMETLRGVVRPAGQPDVAPTAPREASRDEIEQRVAKAKQCPTQHCSNETEYTGRQTPSGFAAGGREILGAGFPSPGAVNLCRRC